MEFANVLMHSKPSHHEQRPVTSSNNHKPKDSNEDKFNFIMSKAEQSSKSKNEQFGNQQTSHTDVTDLYKKDITNYKELVDITSEELSSEELISFESLEYLINEFGIVLDDGIKLDKDFMLNNIQLSDLIVEDYELNNVITHEAQVDDSLLDELLSQLSGVLQQLNLILNNQEHVEDLTRISKDMHKLLQLWVRLPQQMQQSLKENELTVETDEENELLSRLISLFEKRNSFAKQNVYQMNSSITNDDVQKWLQQSLEKHAITDHERKTVNISSQQPIHMSHLQQYTLHVSDSDRIDAISRNLVSDLSNIINRSSFLKQPGLEQLTLTLKPQSLGDVTIRLAQVNGEMTVRFIVTTQAARELFESNLNQLKPIFSPNQVVIERDVGTSDEEFYHEEEEQLEEEQEQKDSEHGGQGDGTNQSEVTFDELLHLLSEEADH